MTPKTIDQTLSVSEQIKPDDIAAIAAAGFKSIICNRPDGEGADQPAFAEIEAAAKPAGLTAVYQPIVSGKVGDEDAAVFGKLMANLPKPIFAYCRTGTRSTTLWSLSEGARGRALPDILATSNGAGYDMTGVIRRIANGGKTPTDVAEATHAVVIIGGGAAGIAVASSLKARKPDLDIALIDPADIHYYQPGWTMVGGGIFDPATTAKTMASLIPDGVRWIKAAVAAFEPDKKAIILDGCRVVKYRSLVVVPGLKLNWAGIEGLSETLGRNGVTSNYRYDLAPYTWELVQGLHKGRAVFTQPPMPIKCAGAPQKRSTCLRIIGSAMGISRTSRSISSMPGQYCSA
jgi:sulfide:quinone oxidoreductase